MEAHRVERKLSAIFAADVEGYSRLMGRDEVGTLRTLTAYRVIIDRLIASHRGRIFNTAGDSILADFASAVDAVRCAIEVQDAITKENADLPAGDQMRFRIGVHVGDIMVQGDNLYGDAVNVAARLEALAEPGGICISGAVQDHIGTKLPVEFIDVGEQQMKNIARPVQVYSLATGVTSPAIAFTADASGPATPPIAPRLSIVVLPFANLSNDSEQEYFADGITDDLTTDLSRISGSFVIARNTAFGYKGKPVNVRQIGHELGVRYVLEGSVRRSGEQVRVNVQLIDAETGAHLWADRFDTDRANLAEAQNEITGRLARALNIELVADAGRRIDREKAANPDVRDLVMQGWAWSNKAPQFTFRKEAHQAFGQALEIDPDSADARVGLASVFVINLARGLSTSLQRDEALAEQLLLEAIERDASNPLAHLMMGTLRRTQNRLAEARIEFETTIAFDRNCAPAIFQLGVVSMFLGQPDVAIPVIEKAMRLNPHDPLRESYYWGLGTCHLLLGQLNDITIDLLRKARSANPRAFYHHLFLAGALGLIGNLDEARAAVAEAIKLRPEVNSLARIRTQFPWGNLQFWSLFENTVAAGLRKAGLPEE